MKHRQYLLMILDGVGINPSIKGNAVKQAHMPYLNELLKSYPHSELKTSGLAVGLPDGQMGNSEVGHMNIGAGRVIYQNFTRINKAISDGTFYENDAFKKAIDHAKKNNSALHIMGLLSGGGVHSHENHLYALLKLAKQSGLKEVYIHAFLDGRDTAPKSAATNLKKLAQKIDEIGLGKIASLSGRYYAMDRDNRWDREELAYKAMTIGSNKTAKTANEALTNSYNDGKTDEFVYPVTIIDETGKPVGPIKNHDSVICFNFRPDRARQIVRAFTDPNFSGFNRPDYLDDLTFVTMTDYDSTLKNVIVAYPPEMIANTLGEYISTLGYSQLRIAETEKYAHVTFFFNGGNEVPYKNEDRILIPSPKVATYDLKPEMSANEVTDKVVDDLKNSRHDVIIMNFANGDMVGHTGNFAKTVEALEALDKCVEKIIKTLIINDGEAIIIADHGNSEYMEDKNGKVVTSHSTFNVPMIVVSKRVRDLKVGSLSDVSPSLLTLMGEKKPTEMSGNSLIELK